MRVPSLGAAGRQGRQACPSQRLTLCPQAAPRPTQSMPRRRESANVQQPGPALGLRHHHVRRLVESGGCQAPVQQRGIVFCPADGGSVPSGREGDDSLPAPATRAAGTNETRYTKIRKAPCSHALSSNQGPLTFSLLQSIYWAKSTEFRKGRGSERLG